MDSSRPTRSSSPETEPGAFELDIPTSPGDVVRLRFLRAQPTAGILERINDLSAIRQFPNLAQRRTTSAGFAPFTLAEK